MKICVLDGYSTNPGDLSWAPLENCGEVTVYAETLPGEVAERAGDCEAVITNRTVLTAALIDALPKLQYIGTFSTGYNQVDLEAARRRSIPVCNVPDYCAGSVAQHVFALLLSVTNQTGLHSPLVREGGWARSFLLGAQGAYPRELEGLTMGVVGFGSLGQRVAALAGAFGMKVLVSSRTQKPVPEGCLWTTTQRLLAESDVVSLHCPLTEDTRELIRSETLASMKPSAVLINTARGGLVREQDLADALNEGRLAGAGLDVLAQEPPSRGCPLLTAKNCVITPHIAWAGKPSRRRLLELVGENLSAFLSGHPIHVVN